MGKNRLIVESKNDKHFFQALISHLNLDIDIEPPILIEDEEYWLMDGLDNSKLTKALKAIEADVQKHGIDKIGIIIDIDQYSELDRLKLINGCIQEAFQEPPSLDSIDQFIDLNFEGCNVKLACHFTHVNGRGELETVLKAIKNKESIYADCLSTWNDCISQHQKPVITQKEFDKFWVDMYVRFDTCSKKDRKQAHRKCSMYALEYIMTNKPDIWDFDNPILDGLKTFLRLFS